MKRVTGKQIRTGAALLLFAAAVLCYAVGAEYRMTGVSEETKEARLIQEEQTVPAEPTEQTEQEEQTEASAEALVYVHVCGAVEHPGVYALSEGSRAWEAAEAAGGFTEEAAETAVNLAGMLTDGQQLWIPTKEEAESVSLGADPAGMMAGSGLTAFSKSEKVNINTASKEALMTLPGIGEARAEAIVAYRQTAGSFQTIEDIMKVSGIKESAFQKIKDDITV